MKFILCGAFVWAHGGASPPETVVLGPGPGQWSKGFFGLPGINVPLEPDVGLDVKVILMPPVSFIERITDGICRAV